ncbi:MAG: class I lanthipeptide [Dysgonamonadaceae bacterium]|jgi:hypothetical protein|nr:class I lanthipeptide [Dysgonamonadaceae bacterium]
MSVKLSKLVLKKEVISNLNDQSQSRIKGGQGTGDYFCSNTGCVACIIDPPPLPLESYDCEGDDTNFVDEGGDCYSQDMEICRAVRVVS